jgi:hypothetical protein
MPAANPDSSRKPSQPVLFIKPRISWPHRYSLSSLTTASLSWYSLLKREQKSENKRMQRRNKKEEARVL